MLQRALLTTGAQPCCTRETVLHISNRYWMSLCCATGTGSLVALSTRCGQEQKYGLLGLPEYLTLLGVNLSDWGCPCCGLGLRNLLEPFPVETSKEGMS